MNSVRNLCGTKAVDGFSREERKLVRREGKSETHLQTKNQNQNSVTVFKGNLDHNTVNKIM